MQWPSFRPKLPSSIKDAVLAVILVSFLGGAVSGAVFGIIGASLITNGFERSFARSLNRASSSALLSSEDRSIVDVVRRVEPAVVSIVITKDVPVIQQNPFYFDPFGGGLQIVPPQTNQQTERREIGGGSGFFVSKDGMIITNRHVVEDEEADYSVLTNDGTRYDAKVLARDSVTDLAVIKIDGSNFPTLPLGDSQKLALGEPVIAIGNALGEFRNTVSTGVVSGLARSVRASSGRGAEELTGVIQTDAAINPGNSGGPLLNVAGEVVGINTAIAAGAQNIGFAIPINEVKQAVKSVKDSGRIVRPYLGVRYVLITPELAKSESLPVDYGALVVRGDSPTALAITPGSPADKAGIKENDIILEIGGQKITVDNPLVKSITDHAVGETISLKILHEGKEKTIQITLSERPQ